MTYLVLSPHQKSGFNQNNIQLDAAGQLDRLPPKAQKQLQVSMETLSANTGLTLVLALSYETGVGPVLSQHCPQSDSGHLLPDEITETCAASWYRVCGSRPRDPHQW